MTEIQDSRIFYCKIILLAKRKSTTTGAESDSDSDDWDGGSSRKAPKKRPPTKKTSKKNEADSPAEDNSEGEPSPARKKGESGERSYPHKSYLIICAY